MSRGYQGDNTNTGGITAARISADGPHNSTAVLMVAMELSSSPPPYNVTRLTDIVVSEPGKVNVLKVRQRLFYTNTILETIPPRIV
ncbi:hypothetical protein J6590_019526 [Homalodisca vitripennis]|nr:hypothetical protein J6590_019526 [Homalodisca vitripennis]